MNPAMSQNTEGGEPLCPKCINWDPRPEDGYGPRVAYCSARDIVTSYRFKCEYYEEASAEKRIARNKSIYGEFREEGGEE
jgi:hypothetical protein